MAARAACLLAFAATATALPQAPAAVTRATVLADAKSAFNYALKNITTEYKCGWERGTYMVGLWEYYNVSGDESAGNYIAEWGDSYKCAPTPRRRRCSRLPAPAPRR